MGAPAGGPPPRVLGGRYRLLEELGRGDRIGLHRAEDLLLSRQVAVEVVAGVAADAGALAAHEAAVRRLASLSLRGLVTLFDVGVEPGDGAPTAFLVLELVEGTDLTRALVDGPLTPRQAAQVGLDLAEALRHLHERGVVHGHVVPAHVLLLDHGAERRLRVKLGGLGLRALLGGDEAGPTAAADVHALGLVLLECLGAASLDAVPAGPWREALGGLLEADPAARPDAASTTGRLRRLVALETGRHRGPERSGREDDRLAALRAYGVLDTPPDGPFDRIAQLAARVLGASRAAIGLVDAERVWFKARVGALPPEVARDAPLHAALLAGGPARVEDTGSGESLAADPLVADGVRFAAAAPVATPEGHAIGLLAVYDETPRALAAGERETLADLAAIVLHELELRRAARRVALARR